MGRKKQPTLPKILEDEKDGWEEYTNCSGMMFPIGSIFRLQSFLEDFCKIPQILKTLEFLMGAC